MRPLFAAIVAAVALLGVAQKSRGCESVQLVAPQAVYASPVQLAAPVYYQPQVLALEVAQPYCAQAFYAAPQQVVVQQQVVRQKVKRQRVVVRQPRVVRQRIVVHH